MATTTATKDSPAGFYEITVSGGKAVNYELTYVNGILTVTGSTGINEATLNGQAFDIYTTAGVILKKNATKLKSLPKGVYIIGGRKIVVR